MKKILILFVSLSACLILYSQENYLPYYELVLKARDASKDNLFKKSDSLYTKAISLVSLPHPNDFIGAAISACKIDSIYKAKTLLLKLSKTGYPIKEFKECKIIFKSYIRGREWKYLEKLYKKEYELYCESLDKNLISTINRMYENDQKYRGMNYVKNIIKQKTLDSINLFNIKKMWQEHGKILGIRELGYEGVMLLYVIFRHVDDNYVLDTLGQQIIKQSKHGDFFPRIGASIIDYKSFMQVSSKKHYMTCQIYGTQVMRTPKTKTRVIIPIKDYENINTLRKSIGLGKLEESTTAIYDEKLVKEECGESFEFCK